ncbi:anaerobic glycerol-3-phosphate dehydrogenase subunit C [Natronobeatus ordinarius]|uniref:anaerobic glycerol-3-phosphate dehydrogenase subunit C n=1 Tax=Natronobeatus ordinarius TaxID=2963433 RepID=UPI0020CF328C|nr:anaerobic glycerol-3-phosphate dehydrogenase subunit C [Natronobeatus ordinarius]
MSDTGGSSAEDGGEGSESGPTDGDVLETDGEGAFDPIEVFPETGEPDLRPGADDCYKCSTCDTNCPVAAVDEEFPGPKFQGPEQWRLKRREDHDIDPSITKCSNCMRCDHACPTGVPLSQQHNTARAEYVAQQVSRFSREYWRNRLLANYGTMARLGSRVPRLTNAVMGLSATKWLNERVLGITSEREFPEFATETFREWWADRGGARVSSEEKRIAYFHGDYANYNTPEVGKALVRVFESFGYEVAVPDQRCSGTPMFANGMLEDARRAATFNVEAFRELVEDGYDVVCSCTSCSFALRQEYLELFDLKGVETVATNTYDAVEYLRIYEDLEGALAEASGDDGQPAAFAYHTPCHARNQGLDGQTVELGDAVDGLEVHDVGDSCSGISGTYGWKRERYETSMTIGAEMFEHIERADADTGLTECPTCAMQMEHGTGYEVRHTLEVLADVLLEQ